MSDTNWAQVGTGTAAGVGGGAYFGPWGALVGGGIGFGGSLLAGMAQSDALDRARKIDEQNAELAKEVAVVNSGRVQNAGDVKIGQSQAEYGAAGVSQTSGSPLDVLAASHANLELDRLNVLHGGTVRAINYQNQAQMDQIGANSAVSGSYLTAVAGLVSGGAKAYGMGAGVSPGSYTPSRWSPGSLGPTNTGLDSSLGTYDFSPGAE